MTIEKQASVVGDANARSPLQVTRNAMTVDVEDYYQVQAFAATVDRRQWEGFPGRVVANTDRVLDLFGDAGISATFFTLGWVGERHRDLIRRIVDRGHELASHGYSHVPVHEQTAEQFRSDVRRTKRLLEDISGQAVKGYRAASFSIGAKTLWAHEVLAEEGYAYSSSIFPVVHDFYGMPSAPRFAFRPQRQDFLELPLTTVAAFGRNIPCSGGGYFRLAPYTLSRWALRRVNQREQQPCIFYFHPWEIDPDQPRVDDLPIKSRLRHYLNLSRMEARLRRLLGDFRWARMDEVFLGNDNDAVAPR